MKRIIIQTALAAGAIIALTAGVIAAEPNGTQPSEQVTEPLNVTAPAADTTASVAEQSVPTPAAAADVPTAQPEDTTSTTPAAQPAETVAPAQPVNQTQNFTSPGVSVVTDGSEN